MKQLLGGILMAIGILIAGASGLCSLAVLLPVFGGGSGSMSMLPLVLIVGGLPCAGGVALAWGGWTVIRRARRAQESHGDVSDIFE